MEENLNYSVQGLKSTFRVYRNRPALAEKHGRKNAINQKANQEAIANNAYAMKIGNGDASTGDGWKYRGRGM
ncbi:glycoside hydrolase family 19 protein, partial [Escherichia coli]|nr:glycoside hydrolase family 19 protein [Escherichia coli]